MTIALPACESDLKQHGKRSTLRAVESQDVSSPEAALSRCRRLVQHISRLPAKPKLVEEDRIPSLRIE